MCDPGIIDDLEIRCGNDALMSEAGLELVGVRDHRAELVHTETPPMKPGALLGEQYWPARLDSDRYRTKRSNGQRYR